MWLGVQLTLVGLRVGEVRRESGRGRPRVFWRGERNWLWGGLKNSQMLGAVGWKRDKRSVWRQMSCGVQEVYRNVWRYEKQFG